MRRRDRLVLAMCLAVGGGCRGCTGIDDYAIDEATGSATGQGGSATTLDAATGGGAATAGPGGAGDPTSGPGTGGAAASTGQGGDCGPCYDGPPGTEDQGICHGGSACEATCEGEVVPLVGDDCTTPLREDCAPGAGTPCTGTATGHGVITENSNALFSFRAPVAADAQGRTVGLVGYLDATYFDGSPLTAATSSMVVWGLDAGDAQAWRADRPAPASGSIQPRAVAMEGDDVVVASQRFDDPINALDVERWRFGAAEPASTRTFLGTLVFFSTSTTVARSGGLTFVAFEHDGSADLDGDGAPDGAAGDTLRSFVAALDDTGATVWSLDPQPGADLAIHALAASDGDVWISGMTVAALDLGCADVVPGDSAFLARLDAVTGACTAVATVGSLAGLVDLQFSSSFVAAGGGSVVSSFPSVAMSVERRTRDLALTWTHPLDATFFTGALAVDPFGHVVVAGGVTTDATTTAFAEKLHRDTGASVWPADVTASSSAFVYFTGATSRNDGSSVLAGSFSPDATLQGVPYAAGGSPSSFYLLVAP